MIQPTLKILSWLKMLTRQMKLAYNAVKLQAGTIPESLKGAPRYFQMLTLIVIALLALGGAFLLYLCWQVKADDVDSWERWGGYYSIGTTMLLYVALTNPMLHWRSNHPHLPSLEEQGRKEWKRITKVAFGNAGLSAAGSYLGLLLAAIIGGVFAGSGLLASVIIFSLVTLGSSITGLIWVAINQYVTRSQAPDAQEARMSARAQRRAISCKEFSKHLRAVQEVYRAWLAATGGVILWVMPSVLVPFVGHISVWSESLLVLVLTSVSYVGFKLFIDLPSAILAFRFKMSYWPRTKEDLEDTHTYAIRSQKLSLVESLLSLGICSFLALLMDWLLGNDDPYIHLVFLGVWQRVGNLFAAALRATYASKMGRKEN